MQIKDAEVIAIKAVGWMADDEFCFRRFLNDTGETAENVHRRLADPQFLAAAIDFLLASDEAVKAFCAASQIPCEAPMAARQLLPGGDAPNWT